LDCGRNVPAGTAHAGVPLHNGAPGYKLAKDAFRAVKTNMESGSVADFSDDAGRSGVKCLRWNVDNCDEPGTPQDALPSTD
jgi:hypothetical protein